MESSHELNARIEALAKAIRRRCVVSFTYHQSEHVVAEPIVLGVHKDTGKTVLRCYKSFPPHLHDSKENWCLCDLEDISNLKITPMRSKSFRKGSKTIEGDMASIIAGSADYIKG